MYHVLSHVDENVICCISPAVFYCILYLFDCVWAFMHMCVCVCVCVCLHYMKLWQEKGNGVSSRQNKVLKPKLIGA